MSAAIPIAAQIAAVRLVLRDAAFADDASVQAALRTLQTVATHADGLRVLIAHLREFSAAASPSEALTASLLMQPAVAAVARAFPGAVLTSADPINASEAQQDAPA